MITIQNYKKNIYKDSFTFIIKCSSLGSCHIHIHYNLYFFLNRARD